MDQDAKLHGLFDTLADTLAKRLKEDSCSSADLNIARQFLRDNNVTATNPRGNPKLSNLVDNLPYDDAEDGSSAARH